MKIEKQKLINIIREELTMVNEADLANLPELEGVDLDYSGEGTGAKKEKKMLGILERSALYDSAMGLGRAKDAIGKLRKAKILTEEDYETVNQLFKKVKKLWADSY
tara:strand:+ start:1297 stop:1614 length:318 start_codon:yes stop_codon:yes gene_type:complete